MQKGQQLTNSLLYETKQHAFRPTFNFFNSIFVVAACQKEVIQEDCVPNAVKSVLKADKGVMHATNALGDNGVNYSWYYSSDSLSIPPLLICGIVADELKKDNQAVTLTGEMQLFQNQPRGFAYIKVTTYILNK